MIVNKNFTNEIIDEIQKCENESSEIFALSVHIDQWKKKHNPEQFNNKQENKIWDLISLAWDNCDNNPKIEHLFSMISNHREKNSLTIS